MAAPAKKCESLPMADGPRRKRDLVYVHDQIKGRKGYRVVRAREDRIELGEMRPLEDGQAIHGDIVKLKPRKEHPRLFDAEVVEGTEVPRPGAHGPPKVSSDDFRRGWDDVFKTHKPRKKPPLLN